MGGTSGFDYTPTLPAARGEGAVVWDEAKRKYWIYKNGTWQEPNATEFFWIREIDYASHPERFAPVTQPTDREQAVSCLLGLIDAFKGHEDDLVGLERVVGKAQNQPPLGAADGTLMGAEWEATRDVARLLRQALAAARKITP
jgi:hypothetical protein